MEPNEAIRKRYGFDFPASYRAMQEQGHFSTDPWENYLELQDCEWLPPEQIATYEFLDFQITSDGGFVPFAVSARRDEYCWRLDWASGSEPPVVLCERGESGFGYAPHFLGFLYRKTLEEFAGFGGVERERDLKRLRQAVNIVAPFLPAAWSAQLRELAERQWSEWTKGKYGELLVLARNELAALVSAQLAFPQLNQKFTLDKRR